MKIIHTSDWHLGQSFFNRSRQKEHQAFLSWLIKISVELKVDAIIVAGDVFDTTAPPSYARQIYHQFISDLNKYSIQVVVLGGNHDSVAVLNESRSLLKALNTFVIPSTSIAQEEQVVVLKNRASQPGAIVCAVPFIRAHDVMQTSAGQSQQSKQSTLEEAIVKHYKDLYELAKTKQKYILEQNNSFIPIIATGHLSALGVSVSESVRDIYIGNLAGFSSHLFPPADYIALGHIHKPQTLAKTQHIRYSGSPIPLSFDEVNTQKQVSLVYFEAGVAKATKIKSMHIENIDIPVFQRLMLVKGDLNNVLAQIRAIKHTYFTNDEAAEAQEIWLSVHIENQDYLKDLQSRIVAEIGEAKIDLLLIKRIRNSAQISLEKQDKETLEELSPSQVFEKRLALESFDSEAQINALRTRFASIYKLATTELDVSKPSTTSENLSPKEA